MTGATPPAVTPPSSPPAPASRPEFLPEKFWDPATGAPKVEDLARSYTGLESRFGQGKAAYETERLARRPAEPSAYAIKVEGIDDELTAKHPLTPVIREVAFEMGVAPEEIAPFAGKFFNAITGSLPDPEKEMAQLGANAETRVNTLEAWVKEVVTDPAEFAAFDGISMTAAGVRGLERLMAAAKGIPLDKIVSVAPAATTAATGTTGKTLKEIRELMSDPRYYSPRHRDPAVIAEVEAWFRANPNAA